MPRVGEEAGAVVGGAAVGATMQRPALVGRADGLADGLNVGFCVGLNTGLADGFKVGEAPMLSSAAYAVPDFRTIPTPCTTGKDRITGATQLTSDSRRVMGAEKIGAAGVAATDFGPLGTRCLSSSLSASISARSCCFVLLSSSSLKTVHLFRHRT